jgi:hypothetical protein
MGSNPFDRAHSSKKVEMQVTAAQQVLYKASNADRAGWFERFI